MTGSPAATATIDQIECARILVAAILAEFRTEGGGIIPESAIPVAAAWLGVKNGDRDEVMRRLSMLCREGKAREKMFGTKKETPGESNGKH